MNTSKYNSVLAEMNHALVEFSRNSDNLNAYEYETQFRQITDHYNELLFQASVGKVPASKNQRQQVKTSFGNLDVKKNTL